ncbi:phage integrase central domain-containing protein [Candidatus Berkiella aquae]|uniref:Tyrosine-type recombinase/integrase n=2 Tax=Candidatus Berkiella aquae TaxID=295108 RepID=A0AAE3HXB6_9GAMM|nr:integrase arm-type DNA-binding domain-containing protein [Candidatus Berkiella aquae]MCS5711456.1 tyrosine-type recombinase/integrase [Candidatus Berkiella aquae]
MPLTDIVIRKTKPTDKQMKLFDSKGLYLLLKPNGARYWRMKYRFANKEKAMALGVYPEVSLAEARELRDDARKKLKQNLDPVNERKQAKITAYIEATNQFETVAMEWLERQKNRWTPKHTTKILNAFKRYIFPDLGHRSIVEINAPELLRTMRKIEAKGLHETCIKVLQSCGAVFRYGIVTGRCDRNPAADLRGALTHPVSTPQAALSAQELPEFLRTLKLYQGHRLTKVAINLIVLTFVRTTELRAAEWKEFDLDAKEPIWRIPAARMKMRSDHLVPLAPQAVELLRHVHQISGRSRLVFPSQASPSKPISQNTMIYALYRMGYHTRATMHGFRATASTILNEQGWRADVIERQLAHTERNKVRAVYNRAEYLSERREMMLAWADYLDGLT